ncbi:cytochrome P450 3A40-like isoform X1 [Corythoichthys intestinalis]|uniref:cytochrome P450 3A40-like isoform X1 n=1 Tax=Corythoichthys intestinalis TaxID=161448 RepID=UPI0025A65CE2|nr:cytochrome P450 3A40-like isoform X1 [Corythoichthys intestinalis]XP_061803660.1 cytochrome P450 3A40-like isoform X2 [Nerophis lumbriciformis]
MGFSLYFSIETWTLIAIVISLLALYGTAPYNFFKKLGIKGPKPLPFIGTFLEYRQGIHNFDQKCFQKYGKVWGLYDGRQPLMAIMDTAMIKTILVKECYSVFTNRRDLGLNGPLNDAVSIVEDEDWKRIRSVLSPSFTSGRLKEMYSIMLQHSSNLLKSLQGKVDADEVINVKDVFGPYSMDVVASTAFSVDIDSINRPADPFVANIQKMTKFNFLNPLIVLVVLFPFLRPLIEKMEISLFPADVLTFFYNFLKTIKSDRKKNNCKSRVDFMQLMVDSQISESSKENMNDQKGLTDHEILSQAMIFIFAGYETSSSSMCFFAYNLATNPHIQKALQEEIDETFPNKVRPNYDDLMQMEYLDMVMNESARLYPIATRLERVAKTSVEVCGVTIPKNSVVMVPIYALHRDPSLWPEPESFKPERFGKENKDNIDPYAFLPFGAGPRNCIGMRFALLMMKLALVEILQHYSFVTCKETEIPLELSNEGFTSPKNPIKIKLMPRATTSD